MNVKSILLKILAVLGSVLVWFPVLSPALFLLGSLGRPRPVDAPFNFDYLMPAEFFPVAMIGGILLIIAEFIGRYRGRLHRPLIFMGLAGSVAMLFLGQGLAMVTGLASGETEPTGAAWGLVLATLAAYVVGLIAAGVGGILLLRDLFRREKVAEQG